MTANMHRKECDNSAIERVADALKISVEDIFRAAEAEECAHFQAFELLAAFMSIERQSDRQKCLEFVLAIAENFKSTRAG